MPLIHIIPHHPGNITRKQGLNKTRNKAKAGGNEEPKSPGKSPQKQAPKLGWNEEKPPETEIPQYTNQGSVNFNAYQHMDFLNFEPMPVSLVYSIVDMYYIGSSFISMSLMNHIFLSLNKNLVLVPILF